MNALRSGRLTSVVVVIVLIVVLEQAGRADEPHPQDDGANIAALTVRKAGELLSTSQTGQSAPSATTSTTYVNLYQVPILVYAGYLVRATFSGESTCYLAATGGGGQDWCSLRIVTSAAPAGPYTEMNPVVGGNFAFDSTNSRRERVSSWESHAIQRFSNCVGTKVGLYVTVQVAVVDAAPAGGTLTFGLDDWVLTVELLTNCYNG